MRAIDPGKCLIILVHMDEKWFYAVVTRTNCKVLTSIGLEPIDYFCQHKNHIQKEMYIVVTAFVMNQNNIRGGGKAIPIACVRVGRMEKAKKDSYKRVYRDDGSYHYPKIAEGLLRVKGQEYFKGVELTGANEGTAKDPKVSLLKCTKKILYQHWRRKWLAGITWEAHVKSELLSKKMGQVYIGIKLTWQR